MTTTRIGAGSPQHEAVLRVPSDPDLHALLPAIVGAGGVGGLLERDEVCALAELDGDLGVDAVVDPGDDATCHLDHSGLDLLVDRDLLGPDRELNRVAGVAAVRNRRLDPHPGADLDRPGSLDDALD